MRGDRPLDRLLGGRGAGGGVRWADPEPLSCQGSAELKGRVEYSEKRAKLEKSFL